MGSAVDRLTRLANAADRFDIPYADLRATQIEAMNERLQERKDQIKLISMRARDAGVSEIRSFEDAVQLLLPHTAYKSYPETWLREERWDRLTKWLGTVSSHPIKPINLDGIRDIDDWIERLEAAGHFVSCSSGTTGKSAMLIASQADMDWTRTDIVEVFSWGAGVKPARDRMMFGCAPVASVPKNIISGDAQADAFGNPAWERFRYPVPPITVGSLTKMVVLRKAMAEGTAKPSDLAEFEKTSKERQQAVSQAIGITAEALIADRDKKLFIGGMWASLYPIARAIRDAGHGGKDFNPDNCIYVGGGLKGAQLPPDYREVVYDTFNIAPERQFQMYSMQEINSGMPKHPKSGRYHAPPWLVPLVLNKEGDALVPHDGKGEIEGRAAFFDVSVDGRWGGVITGDKVSVEYGAGGPTIRDNIVRYSDIEGDDKIGCAGTVDTYVRGLS